MKWILAFLLLLIPRSLVSEPTPSWAETCVQRYAHQYRVPPDFIAALIDVESGWNPNALSKKSVAGERAMGLMQLMPSTARRFGAAQPFDVEQNIAAGTRYVATLMWKFHGDLRLVSAAYNAGDRWVGEKQLNYHNPDVVGYVLAVRRRYMMRKNAAERPTRR
jgi:soluble lytic murein transglycosylase